MSVPLTEQTRISPHICMMLVRNSNEESYTFTHSEKLTLHLGAPDGTILGLLSILGSVVIVTHLLRKVLVLVEIAG